MGPWACAAAFAPLAAEVAHTTETVKVRVRPEVFAISTSQALGVPLDGTGWSASIVTPVTASATVMPPPMTAPLSHARARVAAWL